MGRVHGSPVEYSSYDVTYTAGCRERVTRPARLHGIKKKIETGEAKAAEAEGWAGERKGKRGGKGELDRFLCSILVEGSWHDAGRSRGTYAYTCPRERTRRIYLEIQIAVGMRAVSFLWPSANETPCPGGGGAKQPAGRGRGSDACHQSSLLAIIIHSNDDGCLYPWAWCD